MQTMPSRLATKIAIILTPLTIPFCLSFAEAAANSEPASRSTSQQWDCYASKEGEDWHCSEKKDYQPKILPKPKLRAKRQVSPSTSVSALQAQAKTFSATPSPSPDGIRQLPQYLQQRQFQAQSSPLCVAKVPVILSRQAAKKLAPSAVEISAQRVEGTIDGTLSLEGDVIVNQATSQLLAQSAQLKGGKEVQVQGQVTYRAPGITLSASKGTFSLDKSQGRMDDITYQLAQAHGQAERGTVINQNAFSLQNASYTTCPVDDLLWEVRADEININQQTGLATVKNVSLDVKGVPVFYLPWAQFPIDDEGHTGLLVPSFGVSDDLGTDVSLPFYWSIAPNMDATFVTRYMSKRGLQVQGELRYLTGQHKGQINAEVLPDDSEISGEDGMSSTRSFASIQHNSQFTPHMSLALDINSVSDDDYFRDFGSGLSDISTVQLLREAAFSYNTDHWQSTARLQSHQLLADVLSPYKRLPQMTVDGFYPDAWLGLDYSLAAEYVYFERDNAITGSRLTLAPAASYNGHFPGGYFTPKVQLYQTIYDLDGSNEQSEIFDTSASRTVPVFSFDSGITLERNSSLLGYHYQQTLTPRIFYLYAQQEDQDDIPLFDTDRLDFSYEQLFRDNSFSGGDRFADANQVTLALTNRWFDRGSAFERLSLSIGQIFYFEQRKVNLFRDTTPATSQRQLRARLQSSLVNRRNQSAIVSQLNYHINANLTAKAELHWDPYDASTRKGVFSLAYRGNNNRVVNISHRLRRGQILHPIEQTDFSFAWPIAQNWQIFGRWYKNWNTNEALDASLLVDSRQTLEALLGFGYDNCCWAVRVVSRRYLKRNELGASEGINNFDSGFFLEVELKGLSGFGSRNIASFLERGILGYQNRFGQF